MQPLDDEKEITPYGPSEPVHTLFNPGVIFSAGAIGLAVVGSLLPFISLSHAIVRDGGSANVLAFLSRALYSFPNALPTVWFFSMVIIALITIASLTGVHFRLLYVGQVLLSAFALFWGFMTISTFTEPGRFDLDDHIVLDWGFFFFVLAFTLSIIAGILSVRWYERAQQRDLVKSLKVPGT